MEKSNTQLPFEGYTVVELASVLAGPAVGMFFAELGAKVIKIENAPVGGDLTRHWKLPTEDPKAESSAYYCSVNWGKEVKMLDLRTQESQTEVQSLVKTADIVISNFREEAAEKLGMSASLLMELNPGLIFAHVTGYGADNPRVAFDIVLQAESGFLYMNGEPGRPPVKMPVALIDLLCAHQLKEGILVALLRRAQTGKGGIVSVSLYQAALSSLANQASNWLTAGHIPQALGTLHPNIAPYGEMPRLAGGKSVVLAVGTEKQFKALCKILALTHLAEDADFATNAARVVNRKALLAHIDEKTSLLTAETFMELCIANDVPAGLVRNMSEVFDTPEAQEMVLSDQNGKRVKTVVFDLK